MSIVSPRWMFVALALLGACGGTDPVTGEPLPPEGVTGTWLVTPTFNGTEQDPIHLTLLETGTDLYADVTCNPEFVSGNGTRDGMGFALSLQFTDQDVLLNGSGDDDHITGVVTLTGAGLNGTFVMDRTSIVLDCAHACDPVTVTRFVDVDFTDLSLVQEISLFRSSAGHDYSDVCGPCRSMKHYFVPFLAFRVNDVVPIRAPVDGTVIEIQDEGHGASPPGINKQVRLRSSLHTEYVFILFHVDLAPGIAVGSVLTAGDPIGTARMVRVPGETAHDFDIAVRLRTLYGDRYVSWFDVVTDTLFASYVARGATARSDFVITEAARDADPLTCVGDTFTSAGTLPAWFVLSPP